MVLMQGHQFYGFTHLLIKFQVFMNKWLASEIVEAIEKLRKSSKNNFQDLELSGANPFVFNKSAMVVRYSSLWLA